MQSEVENLAGLSKKLKVTVPKEQVSEEYDKRINDLAKKVALKGFRKGKVPKSVVKMQMGEAIRQEVIQDVLWQTLQQAFAEQKLYPAGTPSIEIVNVAEGAPLEYIASFEVYPEVKVNLDGISVEKLTANVADGDVSEVIEKLRKQNIEWQDVDRPAQIGDMVVIDFDGYIDNEPFSGGSAKDVRLELGSNRMIPGFEEGLIGAEKGTEVELDITFPQDYHSKEHAGKAARFIVKVDKVMQPKLPELNDDFAKDLGVSDCTLKGLHEEVRNNLERELERRIQAKVKEQIIDKLLEQNEIEVPAALIEREGKRLQEQFKKTWSMQTGRNNAPTLPAEQFEEQARKNVLLGLIVSQWIEDNEIKVDKEKVRQRIEEIASGYHQPEEIINWYYSNKEGMAEVEGSVLEEQAMDKILEQVDVTEKPVSFEEIMDTNQQRGE